MSIREFKQRLADLINESGLPLDILEVILEKFMAEVHLATDHAYAEALAKQNETEATVEEISADEVPSE